MKIYSKLIVLLLTLSTGLMACGGGSKGGSSEIIDIIISANTNTPAVGNEFLLKANGVYTDRTSKDITASVGWSTSNSEIAEIDNSGKVTLYAAGNVTFTATLKELSTKKEYIILDKPQVSSITVNELPQTMTTGDKLEISLAIKMTNSPDIIDDYTLVSFSSTDSDVLSVDEEGNIEALSHGEATIDIDAIDSNKSISLKFTINPKVTEFYVEEDIYYIEAGNHEKKSLNVIANYSDEISRDITNLVKWKYATEDIEESFKYNLDSFQIGRSGEFAAYEAGIFYAIPELDGVSLEKSTQIVVEPPLEIITLDDINRIEVAWTHKLNATEYHLYWNTTGNIAVDGEDANIEVISGDSNNRFILDSIDTSQTYYFKVAFFRGDSSEPSSISPELRVQPLKGQWGHKPELTGLRNNAAAVMFEEMLYIFGGKRLDQEGTLITSNQTNRLDFSETSQWAARSAMPYPLSAMAACRYQDSIYLIGGEKDDSSLSDQIIKYLPFNDQWVTTGITNLPGGLSHLSCNTVGDSIYIIGGKDAQGATNSVYIFNPTSEQDPLISAPKLNTARYGHASTVLDKTVYVAGGSNNTDSPPLFESIDTQSMPDLWTVLPQLKYYRTGLSLSTIGNQIYAVGGIPSSEENAYEVEIFTPSLSEQTWSQGQAMPYPNSNFAYTVVNDSIYIFGGVEDAINSSNGFASTMRLDTSLNQWFPNYNPRIPVTDFSSVLMGNQLVLIGGSTNSSIPTKEVQAQDITTRIWSDNSLGPRRPAPLLTPKSDFTSIIFDSKILAIGGVEFENQTKVSAKVDLYSPDKNTWTTISALKKPRKNACSAAVDNQLFVFGGFSGEKLSNRDAFENSVELFNPSSTTWVTATSWNNPRAGASCISLNGVIYIIGGMLEENGFNKPTTKVEIFDPITLKFHSLPTELIEARINPATAVLNGNIYTFGGFTGSFDSRNLLNSAERFVPFSEIDKTKTNDRKPINNLPDYFHHLEAHSYNDKIILIGSKINDAEPAKIENITISYE